MVHASLIRHPREGGDPERGRRDARPGEKPHGPLQKSRTAFPCTVRSACSMALDCRCSGFPLHPAEITEWGMQRMKGKFRGSDKGDGSGLTALSCPSKGRRLPDGPLDGRSHNPAGLAGALRDAPSNVLACQGETRHHRLTAKRGRTHFLPSWEGHHITQRKACCASENVFSPLDSLRLIL